MVSRTLLVKWKLQTTLIIRHFSSEPAQTCHCGKLKQIVVPMKRIQPMFLDAENSELPNYLQTSTRTEDAGIAIRHSQGYISSILQGLGNSLEGVASVCPGSQNHGKGSQIINKRGSPKS